MTLVTGGVFVLLFWGITASSDEEILFNTVLHCCPSHGVILPFVNTSVYEGAMEGGHGIECVLIIKRWSLRRYWDIAN